MRWITTFSLTLFVVGTISATAQEKEKVVYKSGFVWVKERQGKTTAGLQPYHMLLRGGIHFGFNYLKPQDPNDLGHPEKDLSRWPTSYYHKRSPVGVVLQKFNWFNNPVHNSNIYPGDARLPATLVSMGSMPLNFGLLPMDQMVALWSEPPVAVVSIHAGTLASYARPFQQFDFYDDDSANVYLSAPARGKPYFHYLADAKKRGANVQIFKGEPRHTLAEKGPEKFYHVMTVEICPRIREEDICLNLVTKEGMALLFDKLTEDGILCYHISHRFFKMAPVLAEVANSLGYSVKRGFDASFFPLHHGPFTSEWVMVARKAKYLEHLQEPPKYSELLRQEYAKNGWPLEYLEPFWSVPGSTGLPPWTDKSKHPLKGILWSDPTVAYLAGFVNIGLKISNRRIPWWKATGGKEEEPYFYPHPLAFIIAEIRQELGVTVEDLNKGYPVGN